MARAGSAVIDPEARCGSRRLATLGSTGPTTPGGGRTVGTDQRPVRNDNSTVPTDRAVTEFVAAVPDPTRRADAGALVDLAVEVTGAKPVMWGSSIIGFGRRHYRYASGREGDVAAVSFSPRKNALTLYLTGSPDEYADLLTRLGPHSLGKGCLYLPGLDRVDLGVLRQVLDRSYRAAADAGD
jgi:hypothetical protein